jgi:hypothetical protein
LENCQGHSTTKIALAAVKAIWHVPPGDCRPRTVGRKRPKLTKKGKPEEFSGKVMFFEGKAEGKARAKLGQTPP